jgi:hypothetical protein
LSLWNIVLNHWRIFLWRDRDWLREYNVWFGRTERISAFSTTAFFFFTSGCPFRFLVLEQVNPLLDHFLIGELKSPIFVFLFIVFEVNEIDGQIFIIMLNGLDALNGYFGFWFDLTEIDLFGVILFDIKLANIAKKLVFT